MVIALVLIIIVILILFFWSVFTFIGLIRSRGVPAVYLTRDQLRGIVKNIVIDKDKSVVDLGCGDGRVLRVIEKQGVSNLIGYEVNYFAIMKGKIINLLKRSKVKIEHRNFFKVNLENQDVVFCYLLKSCLKRLLPKFQSELKSGAMVISYGFEVPGWKEDKIIYTNEKNRNLNRIFIYKIK